jgi:Biopolymer transport protein ExbD/TolR
MYFFRGLSGPLLLGAAVCAWAVAVAEGADRRWIAAGFAVFTVGSFAFGCYSAGWRQTLRATLYVALVFWPAVGLLWWLRRAPEPPAPTITCAPHPTLEGYEVCGQAPLVAVGQGYDTGTRPQNPSASDRQPRSAKPLFLTIKSDLTLTLGNDPVARDALVGLLNTASGGDKDRTIFLRADKGLPYGEVMSVMNLLRAAGYVKFALVTE